MINNSYQFAQNTNNINITSSEHIQNDFVIQSMLGIFYGFIFVFGIAFNVVIILIYTKKQSLKNFTKYFFINLSLSDMMLLSICIPRTITDLFFDGEWRLGYFYCKSKLF